MITILRQEGLTDSEQEGEQVDVVLPRSRRIHDKEFEKGE